MGKRGWLTTAAVAAGIALAYRHRRHLVGWILGLPPAAYEVEVERNLRVPAGEGLSLATDHYAPVATGSFPTILIRTPYGRRISAALYARRFAERGYHAVVQDVRGRFGSDGEFAPFINEVVDGEATLDWLARQPWYNGVVGMWGQSYVGYVQWAAATARPDAFSALCVIIASSRGTATGQGQGGFHFELALRWMILLDALNTLAKRAGVWPSARALWRTLPAGQNRIVGQVRNHLPLQEVDRLATGSESRHFRQSLQPEQSARWAETDRRHRLAQVRAPAHLVGGWYDFMLQDLLGDYAALQAEEHNPYLTIGPWHHMDPEVRRASLKIGLQWFAAHLQGARADLRTEPVRVYVMGADEWRDLPAWPPPAHVTRYYLQREGGLAPEPPPAGIKPDRYRYDPANPTPAVGGARFMVNAGPRDNRTLEARPDVLTYTTPPLADPMEIIGPVRAELFVQSTLRHTDFFARLCDVDPSGRSINLCDGLYRVKPGKGERQPDGSLRLKVNMWATAHRFLRGHRIRLQLSSGAHPRYLRHLGTGAPLGTATEMRVATQTVYHDAAHPSALILPAVG